MKLLNSFGYAFKGMWAVFKSQRNMRIHAVAVVMVTVAGIFLELTAIEWAIIALTIGSVMGAEMFNSAIETLVDLVSPEYNEKAGKVKDIAAGAVLLHAIVASVVAIYIFGNKIFNLLL